MSWFAAEKINLFFLSFNFFFFPFLHQHYLFSKKRNFLFFLLLSIQMLNCCCCCFLPFKDLIFFSYGCLNECLWTEKWYLVFVIRRSWDWKSVQEHFKMSQNVLLLLLLLASSCSFRNTTDTVMENHDIFFYYEIKKMESYFG